jgi:hypothetical protein
MTGPTAFRMLPNPLLKRKRPTNPFLSASVVWSLVSSGFKISPDEVVHERVGAIVA